MRRPRRPSRRRYKFAVSPSVHRSSLYRGRRAWLEPVPRRKRDRRRRRLDAGADGERVWHLADRVGRLRVELVPLCLVVEQPAARRGGGRCSGRGGGGGRCGGGGGGSNRGRGACSARCGRVVTPIPLATTLSFGAPKLPRLRLPRLLHLASSAGRSAALPDEERKHKPAQAESHLHVRCSGLLPLLALGKLKYWV